MNSIEAGAKQAVVNCLKVKKGQRVVVITDRKTLRMGDAMVRQARKAGGLVEPFVMEDFGPRPADGKRALRFPDAIRRAMSRADVSVYIAGTRAGELHSFRLPMLELMEKKRLRHGHMPGFLEVMMRQGMAVDYAKVQALTKKVLAAVRKARSIRVITPAGTDLTATFPPRSEWHVCDGNIRPGKVANLPAGEVYTVPASVDGRAVIDGCLGDAFDRYGALSRTPVSYALQGGRCVKGSVRCRNARLRREFNRYTFESDAHSDRVGEFAIGTNLGLKKLIGNMLQDEKFPSVHLAMGDPATEKTRAPWRSKVHLDGLMLRPTIVVDGRRTIMAAGKFRI
ncbi:MAG: aminopeptidase [Elusimicrobiota bacterium]|jgi:leucyl aminopeptidase (aminopeptidase T)